MNPWIAGRIIDTMHQEARKNGEQARLRHHAGAHREAMRREVTRRAAAQRRAATVEPPPRPRRRVGLGLAVARLGFRIAGRRDEAATTRPAVLSGPIDSTYRSNPWTTCGATSTSSR